MRTKVVVLTTAILATASLLIWREASRPRKAAGTSASASEGAFELAQLKAEVSHLQRRLDRNERVADTLAERVELGAPATSGSALAPTKDELEETPLRQRLPRPTQEQQTARFEKHFANLDALRGDQRQATLETQFRALLTNDVARKFPGLAKVKIEEVSCGNEFCKVELDFEDPGVARMGQTEMQIQLAPLSQGATIYMNAGSSRLHAYFATGNQRLPDFPALEEVALGGHP